MPVSAVISVLARCLLAGEPIVEDVYARAVGTLGRPWRWLRPLAARYVAAFGGKTRPRHRDVVQFLRNDAGLQRAWAKYRYELSVAQWLGEPQRMQPVRAAQGWDLPIIESVGDLAEWLSLSTDDLEWFADLKGLGNKLRNPKLQHYHYSIRPKRSGGVRLIEMPKPRLKELQRRILTGILGTAIATGALLAFVSLVAMFVLFLIKIRMEEQFLLDEFGEEYGRYRGEVKALVPYVL